VSISLLPHRNSKLLPEVHAELIGVSNTKHWLSKAEAERLDPIELRKQIRQKSTKKKEKPLNVATYPKYTDAIQRELKTMAPDAKEKAIQYIMENLRR